MARLPLLGLEPADEITAAVFETFRQEGRDPIALYRVLAHSPPMLRAYAGLARGLRYEARDAARAARADDPPHGAADGLGLRMGASSGDGGGERRARGEGARARRLAVEHAVRRRRERAALRCVDEIHDVALSDEAFAELEREIGPPGTIELVLLAAFYEAVARIIQALGLEVEPAYQAYLGERDGNAAPVIIQPSKESDQ